MLKSELLQEFHSLSESRDVEALIKLGDKLDEFFELEKPDTESIDKDHYPELSVHALNTSYIDYFNLLNRIPQGESIVDLGAGSGRGSVLSCFLELTDCISFEIEKSRVDILKNALKKFSRVELAVLGDLSALNFPKAKHYYFYFPRNRIFYSVLRYLSRRDCSLYICESHGDVLPFLSLLSSFFKKVGEIPLFMPRWEKEIHIYKTQKNTAYIKIEENFPAWFLQNFDSDQILILHWKNKNFEEDLQLYLPVRYCDLELFKGDLSIKNTISNRQYLLGSEVHVLKSVDNRGEFISLFKYFNAGLKVFRQGKNLFVEKKTGVIEILEFQCQSDT